MDNWWKKPEIVSQLADWSYDLVSCHPHDRLLSLGQSPAWAVKGAGMIRKLRGEASYIGFVPFTGTFLRRVENMPGGMFFTDLVNARPGPDRINRYFNTLSKIGVHPAQVATDKRKTVLVEMIKKANGLAAFLDLWSKETDGTGCLSFYIFDTEHSTNSDKLHIQDSADIYQINRRALNRDESEIMEGITPHNHASTTSSRLTPIYRLNARKDEEGMVMIPNKEIRREIQIMLHAEIQRREQESRRSSMKLLQDFPTTKPLHFLYSR